MKKFTGIPGSPGIVVGKALLYVDNDLYEIPRYTIRKNQVESEWKRFLTANAEASEEVRALHNRMIQDARREEASILDAHLMMLEDTEFQDQIKERLYTSLENIEWVVWSIFSDMKEKLLASPDPYLRERATDVSDVSQRMLHKLLAIKRASLTDLKSDVILVSYDLLPSDILAMNKKRVKGIVTDAGSRTSHTAILARAFAIPAVLGLSTITKEIKEGEKLMVNGSVGEVIVNPDKQTAAQYQKTLDQYRKTGEALQDIRELPAETGDGRRVHLKANIEVPEEVAQAFRYGAEGIGLYRSEFLFLTSGQVIDEEEQYQAYRQVLKNMGDLPVTIRTLDIGGDKLLPEFQGGNEKNPLLGWRAIRFSLSLPELFKTQLRALLRAGVDGNLRIMFPMISGIEELEQALAMVEEAKADCYRKGQAYMEQIAVGTMVEIPAAAMTADILAERSDFFSIGTNDLIQYTLAVDRGNEKVGYLAQPFHPAMLRFFKRIIDGAHARRITVGMCGELAGDPLAAALLLGLGLDEFSMIPQSIPLVKRIIRGVVMEDCRALAEEALRCTSSQQVALLLEVWMAKHFPDGEGYI